MQLYKKHNKNFTILLLPRASKICAFIILDNSLVHHGLVDALIRT
jgi:hypothetical protein